MGRALSELTSKDVGGEENLNFLKKIFSQKVIYDEREKDKIPGKAPDIPGQILKIKLNAKFYFCQIRISDNKNYHCISFIENDDGTISLGSFTMIYFSGKDNLSFEEIISKYNFNQTMYHCEIIYNN